MKQVSLCTVSKHKCSCRFGISIYDEATDEKNGLLVGRKKKVISIIHSAMQKHP